MCGGTPAQVSPPSRLTLPLPPQPVLVPLPVEDVLYSLMLTRCLLVLRAPTPQ